MSGRIYQNVVLQLKENTDRTIGVMDGEGVVIACSELSLIGQRWTEYIPVVNNAAGALISSDGRTFKALNGWGNQFDYAAFAFGENDVSKAVCSVATVALNAAKAYYEDVDNPYIGDFYEDMSRWAFQFQIWFLGSRIQQTISMLSDGTRNVVQDRTIYEDAHIFADNLHRMGLMSSRDFGTYMKIFDIQSHIIPRPDVLIYLKASVETLISQIKLRGREYEQNIDEDYLRRLNDKYDNWIENIYDGPVLVIDKDVDDFVRDPSIIDRICERLEAFGDHNDTQQA